MNRKKYKLKTKSLLLVSRNRKFIIKNHMFLEETTLHIFLQSLLRDGKRSKSEVLLLTALKLLQPLGYPSQLLHLAAENLLDIVEISPVRTGKKVRMVARASGAARQHRRSPYLIARRLRSRRFLGQPFIGNLTKELVSSLYFPEESARRTLQVLIFSAGFLNLRYLYKRWY